MVEILFWIVLLMVFADGVWCGVLCSYLIVLDKTNWRTNLLTAILVPYLALQLPEPIFGYLRCEIHPHEPTLEMRSRVFLVSGTSCVYFNRGVQGHAMV